MRISVALRVSGDNLSPDEITSVLNVNPHVARKKGEVRVSSSGRETISNFGYWTWKSEHVSDSFTINDHFNRLHSVFGHAYTLLSDLPHAENTWIDICIVKGEEQEGDAQAEFLLDPHSVRILHDIGLPVEFTIY